MTRLFTACLSLLALATAAHADTRVTATWYGNELRGHRTASGALFNPDGLTAAHRRCRSARAWSSVIRGPAKASE